MIKRNKLMFTAPDSGGRRFILSNARIGKTREYLYSSPDVSR
jgi:hypothetical protein